MVTTTKAPSKTAAADSTAPKKTAAVKTTTAKTAAAKTSVSKPTIKTTFAPMPATAVVKPAAVTEKPVPAPTAAKVPAPAKAAAKKPAAKKIPASQTPLKPSTAPKPALSTEQRNHYVAVAAFYLAERRGFTLGDPVNDWLAAEAEVDRLIASGHFIG